MNGKMAIIGDGDGALVFRSAGMDAYAASDTAEAKRLLVRLAKEYQVIFVTDFFAAQMEECIAAYASEAYPIIMSVPSVRGGNGYGEKMLRRQSERALGMDILPRAQDKTNASNGEG